MEPFTSWQNASDYIRATSVETKKLGVTVNTKSSYVACLEIIIAVMRFEILLLVEVKSSSSDPNLGMQIGEPCVVVLLFKFTS